MDIFCHQQTLTRGNAKECPSDNSQMIPGIRPEIQEGMISQHIGQFVGKYKQTLTYIIM